MAIVARKCEYCGDSFNARAADVKRGWARFCSKVCKAKEQEKRTGQFSELLKSSTEVFPEYENGYEDD